MIDPLAKSLSSLADALERLRIPYLIGGSVASGVRGIMRATGDVDLLAHILTSQADRLAAALGPEWYSEPEQIRESIRRERSFNVIHIPLANKIDIFPATEEFHVIQLERATKLSLPFLGDGREYPVASAEDILLSKLNWYSIGGETSDRQWQDIMGIVKMNPSMDLHYLNTWATRLRVEKLLSR